jgi:hypothetical protein
VRWVPAAVLVVVALSVAPPAQADRAALERYADATWASFVAMTEEESGLPTDLLHADGSRAVQTSTTNIGAYMWSAVAAERLGIIDHGELVARLDRTHSTLERMERFEGQYYNWYDHRTGDKLTTWPPTGQPLTPILSSVDNGWLATGLKIVESTVPEVSARAGALYDSIDFGFYYVSERNRILFHYVPSERAKTSFAAGTARTCCRPARATMLSPGARAPTTPRAARGATPASPTQRTTRPAAADGCAALPSAAHLTQCVAVDALSQRAPEVGSVFSAGD